MIGLGTKQLYAFMCKTSYDKKESHENDCSKKSSLGEYSEDFFVRKFSLEIFSYLY